MSEITWGLYFTLLYKKRDFLQDFPVIAEKSFGRVEETTGKVNAKLSPC
jgi:hypothetical protein